MGTLFSRRNLILVGIVVAIIIMALLVIMERKQSSPSFQVAERTFLEIPNLVVGNKPVIESQLKEGDFTFPASVPAMVINKTNVIQESDAQAIAQRLNFEGAAQQLNDVFAGTTYLWSNDENTLVVYSKTRTVDYSLVEIPDVVTKSISKEQIIQKAKDFFTQFSLFPKDEIEFSFITEIVRNEKYSIQDNLPDTEKAYQVNFTPKIAQYKTVTDNPTSSPIQVTVFPDGTITRVQMVLLGQVTPASEQIFLKNKAQVDASLNKAKIVSLARGEIILQEVEPNTLTKITITGIELGYFIPSSSAEILYPIYLLRGSAQLAGRQVEAVLYLPAASTDAQP